jgi:importin subunit alpha-6/7
MFRTRQDRQRDFKKGISGDDARRKREDNRTSLRKSRRDEQLQKRRFVGKDESALSGSDLPVSLDTLPGHVQGIMSGDGDLQFESTLGLRRLLSVEKNPPIGQVVAMGAVPRLVEFLADFSRPKLQFEAAWVLTNVASGTTEQTYTLIEHNAVLPFVQLCQMSPDKELQEQCIWALGNIAGDSHKFRDYCLQQGMLQPVLQVLMDPTATESMHRNTVWALSNLCRGKPQPDFAVIREALPVLAQLIKRADQELVIDALWALSYLSDGKDENIAEVVNSGVAPTLVQLLSSTDFKIQTPALRTVGNIVTGTDEQTEIMLAAGMLHPLSALLRSDRKGLRKEAAWAISNVTAGNATQTQQVFEVAGIIPELIHLLNTSDYEVKKECAWAVSNATTWKVEGQIRFLVRTGLVGPLCNMLKVSDVKTIKVLFEAMENILRVGNTVVAQGKSHQNEFYEVFDESEVIDRLEELQDHEDENIYKTAVRLLEEFFGAEDEQENAGSNFGAPDVANGQFTFAPPSFGLPSQQNQGTFAF